MIWATVLLVLAGIIFGTTPLVKRQLTATLTAATGQTILIDGLKLRPFHGQVTLTGVTVDCCADTSNRIDELYIDLQIMPLLDQQLVIEQILLKGAKLEVVITGDVLEIAGIATDRFTSVEPEETQPTQTWQVDLANLTVADSVFNVTLAGSNHVIKLSEFALGPISTNSDFVTELVTKVELDGALIAANGSADVQSGLGDAAFEVELTAEKVDLSRYSRFAGGEFEALKGTLSIDQAMRLTLGDTFSLATKGTLSLSQFVLPRMGEADQVTVEGQLALSSDGFDRFEGDVLVDAIRQSQLGSIKRVSAKGLKVIGSQFDAEQILVDGANVALERDAKGSLKLPDVVSTSAEVEDDSDSQEVAQEPPQIAIELFEVTNSRFEFVDRSVEPLVDLSLSEIALKVESFSLTETFKVDLSTKHHDQEESVLLVNGNYALGSQTGDISVKLSDFEIHEVAPYLGNGVKSGRLRLTSEIGLKRGHIKVANDVYIRKVKVEDRATSGDQMSLSTALFMLKDSNDVVELKVPIETDLKNFNVGLGDIIQRAMLTAARTAAVAYAQYALQPYGSLLLAKNVLGAVTRPKFEPVRFQPGSSNLGETDIEYMKKLGKFLAAKPELTVTVCGYAQESELEALQSVLEASDSGKKGTPPIDQLGDVALLKKLAESRSKAVRDSLLQANVKSSQLYGCTAAVEAKDRLPRVELAL